MHPMNRRTFMALSASSPFFLSIDAYAKDVPASVWRTIESVQEVLLPATEQMPSAKNVNALFFLIVNSTSPYFDQNDLELLIEGASVFNQKFSHFFQENAESQYRIVELASEDAYLEQWLSRLIYYTLEAMLGDPIYGGNTEEIGWKSVLHVKGEPRPKSTYGSKV